MDGRANEGTLCKICIKFTHAVFCVTVLLPLLWDGIFLYDLPPPPRPPRLILSWFSVTVTKNPLKNLLYQPEAFTLQDSVCDSN